MWFKIIYKKYNNSSNAGLVGDLSDCACKNANLCASWHKDGTRTVPLKENN